MRVNLNGPLAWSIVSLIAAGRPATAADMRLMEAVKSKNTTAVSILLKERADVNAPRGDGATALHLAVHLDDLKTADLLLRAGARVNEADDLGVTPLYLACTN